MLSISGPTRGRCILASTVHPRSAAGSCSGSIARGAVRASLPEFWENRDHSARSALGAVLASPSLCTRSIPQISDSRNRIFPGRESKDQVLGLGLSTLKNSRALAESLGPSAFLFSAKALCTRRTQRQRRGSAETPSQGCFPRDTALHVGRILFPKEGGRPRRSRGLLLSGSEKMF